MLELMFLGVICIALFGIFVGVRIEKKLSSFVILKKYMIVIGTESLTFVSILLLEKMRSMIDFSKNVTLDYLYILLIGGVIGVVMNRWVREITYWSLSVFIFIMPIAMLYSWGVGENTIEYLVAPFLILFLFLSIFFIIWICIKFKYWLTHNK